MTAALEAWRRRRALRRARKEAEEGAREDLVRGRIEALLEEVVGPYIADGSARVEQVHRKEMPGPEIRVSPTREGATAISIGPGALWPWFPVSVGDCTCELHVGEPDWDETLAVYLRSVVEGHYREIGGRGRLGPYVKMTFDRPDGETLTYTVGGLYEGAERDYPPGERHYQPYR